jgi:hypothetical protein
MGPKESILQAIEDLKQNKEKLRSVLRDNGYFAELISFSELTEALNKAYVLNPSGDYTIVETDADGFIVGLKNFNVSSLIKKQGDYPQDVLKGYYRLEGGKVVEDAKRKEQLLSLD